MHTLKHTKVTRTASPHVEMPSMIHQTPTSSSPIVSQLTIEPLQVSLNPKSKPFVQMKHFGVGLNWGGGGISSGALFRPGGG